MATSSEDYRIPKLFTDNYHAWSIRARAALVQKGIWEAIDPGNSKTLTAADKKVDNKALTLLFLIVDDNYLDDIGGCLSAKEAWQTLEEIHPKHGFLHILQLMRDFFNVKMGKTEQMRDYLGRITELHRKLTSSGYRFTDKELALVMLMGLPKGYEPLILNLEQDQNSQSTKKLKVRLLIEEKRKVRREEERLSDNEGDSSKALFSRN
ncbi:hypothetical protein CBL_20832 [Carabus blaptoides fortunei]